MKYKLFFPFNNRLEISYQMNREISLTSFNLECEFTIIYPPLPQMMYILIYIYFFSTTDNTALNTLVMADCFNFLFLGLLSLEI